MVNRLIGIAHCYLKKSPDNKMITIGEIGEMKNDIVSIKINMLPL